MTEAEKQLQEEADAKAAEEAAQVAQCMRVGF